MSMQRSCWIMNRYQEALNKIVEVLQWQYMAKRGGGKTLIQNSINTLQQLVDKETPKKPIERLFEKNKHLKVCPSCWEKDIKTFVYGKYCDECGQRLE